MQRRDLVPDFDNPSGVETFVELYRLWSAIETVEGTKRFAGIAIDDRATHLFYVRFNSSIVLPEDGNHFIDYNGKRFRALRVTNDGEDNRYLIVQCSDRGDDDVDGSSS